MFVPLWHRPVTFLHAPSWALQTMPVMLVQGRALHSPVSESTCTHSLLQWGQQGLSAVPIFTLATFRVRHRNRTSFSVDPLSFHVEPTNSWFCRT